MSLVLAILGDRRPEDAFAPAAGRADDERLAIVADAVDVAVPVSGCTPPCIELQRRLGWRRRQRDGERLDANLAAMRVPGGQVGRQQDRRADQLAIPPRRQRPGLIAVAIQTTAP